VHTAVDTAGSTFDRVVGIYTYPPQILCDSEWNDFMNMYDEPDFTY